MRTLPTPSTRFSSGLTLSFIFLVGELAAPMVLVARAGAEELPPNLVALDSAEGERLLAESNAKQDLFPLIRQYLSQDSLPFCGVASSVMVLNAMPIKAPLAAQWAPYHMYTQENVFNEKAAPQVTLDGVKHGGMTLAQVAHLLRANGTDAVAHPASEGTVEQFRAEASKNLAEPGNYVVVNFMRSALGQEPPLGGHWSPLGAYDEKADRFLVLDVARFRYPPFWATTADLWKAMDTLDPDAGKTRGWVTVAPGVGASPEEPIQIGHKFIRVIGGVLSGVFLVGALFGALLTWLRMRRRVTPS